MARQVPGIRRHGNGWRAFVRINGRLRIKCFPLDTPLYEMTTWREAQRQTAPPTVREQASGRTTLAQDIEIYLDRVKAIRTIGERRRHLEMWADRLGPHRSRHDITPAEIDTILQAWMLGPSARGTRLSPSTAKRRRMCLGAFYARMNGPMGLNPVKGSLSPKEPKPGIRAIDYDKIEQALALMAREKNPYTGQPSLAAIRARVIAYTGLPPASLKQVQPWALRLRTSPTMPYGTVTIAPRLKGGGIEARTLPLTEQGLAAFQAFHDANAYGDFGTDTVNKGFQAACRQIGLTGVRLYDLRHSFLTELYRTTRDIATVGRLGLHAEGSAITARYTKGANAEIDIAAVIAFGDRQVERRRLTMKTAPGEGLRTVQGSSQKLPKKLP